jgi:hypothetical protein
MKTPADICARLQERLLHECQSMRSKRQRMKKLASAYNEYLDLDEEIKVVHHRMSIILGLLGPGRTSEAVDTDTTNCLGQTLEAFDSPKELRERLTLWRAIREYLRVAGESRISDVQAFLSWIGIQDFSRQALESALVNHEDVFEISKRGRERYIALK